MEREGARGKWKGRKRRIEINVAASRTHCVAAYVF